MPVLPSYRNQSIDLQNKSIDWFLFEGNIGKISQKPQENTYAWVSLLKKDLLGVFLWILPNF